MRIAALLFLSFAFLLQASQANAKVRFAELEKAARSYAEQVSRQHPPGGADGSGALAKAKQAAVELQWAAAISAYETAAALKTGGAATWLDLARAWHNLKPSSEEALSAAYMAYSLAQTKPEETETLQVLAGYLYDGYTVSAKRLKDAQSQLNDVSSGSIEQSMDKFRAASDETLLRLGQSTRAYKELRSLMGKRNDVVEERAGQTAPAVFSAVARYADVSDKTAGYCVRFSLPLKTDADSYRSVLSLTKNAGEEGTKPQPAAVAFEPRVSERALCLYGLEHGATYTLKLSAKFASADGRELGTPAAIGFFVADRGEQVRFRTSAFVLPKHSDGVIPMRTINVSTVAVNLVRVNDRNLIREMVIGKFGAGLNDMRREALLNNDSEPIWDGRIQIASPARNEEMTTNLPVMKLLNERRARLASTQEAGARGADAAGMKLSLAPFIGEMRADSREWERTVNAKPPLGVYAVAVKTIASGPDKIVSGYQASQTDKSAVPEETNPGGAAPAAPGGPKKNTAPRGSMQDPPAEEENQIDARNPADRPSWSQDGKPLQWFVVTDIGLTYYEGRSKLYVMARSLQTAKALEGVTIQLVSANNRVLSEVRTGKDGVAEFPVRLAQGRNGNRLAAVFAAGTDDFSFIDFKRDFFDMSNRGAEGRAPAKHLDAYVYTDRGVYRPGEQIQATVLVRDPLGNAPNPAPPLGIVLRGADGVALGARQVVSEWPMGGALVKLTLPENAPLGMVRIDAEFGSEGERIGSAVVQIDHFKPDRARLSFDPASWKVEAADSKATVTGSATVQYLYGIEAKDGAQGDAFAQGAVGEAEFLLRRGTTPVKGCYDGYAFGPGEEKFVPALWRKTLDQASDAQGRLPIGVTLDSVPEAQHPLDLSVSISAFDPAGVLARRSETRVLPRRKPMIGVKLLKTPALASGGEVAFDILALDANNQPRSRQMLKVQLMSERDDFIWVNAGESWKPSAHIGRKPVEPASEVETGDAAKGAQDACWSKNAGKKFNLAPGRYFLTVTDGAGTTTSLRFTVGWSSSDAVEPAPDTISILADKENGQYRVGDDANFSIYAPFDGQIAIAISDGDIIHWASAQTDGRQRASVKIPIPAIWRGKALYAVATVFRAGGSGEVQPGPARALGAAYFEVERREDRRIAVEFDASEIMLDPGKSDRDTPFNLNLSARGLNEPATAVIFAVDEGILNLTRHKEADPFGYFFGRQALGLGILDSYGRIILSERNSRDRDGGDMLPRSPDRLAFQNYLSERIVAMAYGPVTFTDGKASIGIYPKDLRGFDGTLRLVAVVWSAKGAGTATAKVVARSAVVAKLGVPRFIATGDTAIVPLSVHNVQGKPGQYEVAVSAGNPLKIERVSGPGQISMDDGRAKLLLPLAQGEKALYQVTLSSPADKVEVRETDIKVDMKGAEPANVTVALMRDWKVNMRPPLAASAQLVSFKLAPGASHKLSASMLEEIRKTVYVPETFQVSARIGHEAGPSQAIASALARDVPPRSLDGLVAAGTLLLGDTDKPEARAELLRVVGEIGSLQVSGGGFINFQPDGARKAVEAGGEEEQSSELASIKPSVSHTAAAVDLLAEAEARNIANTADARELAFTYLKGELRTLLEGSDFEIYDEDAGRAKQCSSGRLYAAYVLARYGRLEGADVRAVADRCQNAGPDLGNNAVLAAMLNSFGAQDRAKVILAKLTQDKPETGPDDVTVQQPAVALAETWAHLVAAGAPPEVTDQLMQKLAGDGKQVQQLPLGALAWISRGLDTLAKRGQGAGTVNVALKNEFIAKTGAGYVSTRLLTWEELQRGIDIKNSGQTPLTVTLTLRGQARQQETSPENGLTIRRRFFNARGEELSGGKIAVRQNKLVYVVLEGLSLPAAGGEAARTEPVAVIDTLPSGFEIMRRNIFASDDTEKYLQTRQRLDFEGQGDVRRVEVRDDHWVAIVQPVKKTPKDTAAAFRLGYTARATVAGTLALPPAAVEDLESPEISAVTVGANRLEVERAE